MMGINRREFVTTALAAGLLGFTRNSSASSARVVIIGGGFGGISAARALRRLAPDISVTLIESNPRYLTCPGSNQVIAGIRNEASLIHDYNPLARAHGFKWLKANATGIDSAKGIVTLGDRSSIAYDRLIVATGMDFRWDAIEGYTETISQQIPHAWKAGPQTLLLRKQLQSMRKGGTVIISAPENPYRCPPGPYERASLMAHYLARHNAKAKILILDAKTQFSKQKLFMQAWKELYPGMIEWVSSEGEGKIDHLDAKSRVIHTEFGEHRGDVINLIPPQKAGKLASMNGLTDASGWCPVDPISFESTLAPGIHIIGDACNASPMPKSAFSAHSQAEICAVAIVRLLTNSRLTHPKLINHCFSFVDPDQAISVTGVYGYNSERKALDALSTGESAPTNDRQEEAKIARDWYALFLRETFD